MPGLRRDLALDLVVVNAENAAHGFGLTERLCGEFYDCGVDVLTTGNHVWDQRELIPYIERDPRVLRPANFPPGTPGAGWRLHPLADGRTALVVNLMGRLFMDALDDPFARLEAILADHPLGRRRRPRSSSISTPRRRAKRWRSAISPTAASRRCSARHTHIPTADAQILPGGTAYQTDAGMCGDYDLVIGLQKAPAVRRFVTKMPGERPQVAEGEGTLVRRPARNRRCERSRPPGRAGANRRPPHPTSAPPLTLAQQVLRLRRSPRQGLGGIDRAPVGAPQSCHIGLLARS